MKVDPRSVELAAIEATVRDLRKVTVRKLKRSGAIERKKKKEGGEGEIVFLVLDRCEGGVEGESQTEEMASSRGQARGQKKWPKKDR